MSFSFGTQNQGSNMFGSNPSTPAKPLFGNTNTGGGFSFGNTNTNTNTNAGPSFSFGANDTKNTSTPITPFGGQQNQAPSIFGGQQNQGSSMFGGQQNQAGTPSQFNQNQPQGAQPQSFGGSLFGSSQANQNQITAPTQQQPFGQSQFSSQPNFTWNKSQTGPSTFGQPQSSMFGNQQTTQQPNFNQSIGFSQPAMVSNAQYGPAQPPSVVQQMQKLQSSWDRNSPDCAFQYYFYNRVPAEQAPLYQKPPNHNQQKWDEAVAKRPDNGVVPVLAVGFADVQRRLGSQEQQVIAYRTRMHEIVNKVTELSHQHDLSTTVKVQEAKIKHIEISRRALNLAIQVQVTKSRGYALRPDEEKLKSRLLSLSKRINDPAVFGRVNEIWARMTLIREQAQASNNKDRAGSNEVDWTRDEDQLAIVAKVLRDQQISIAHVTKVLQEDMKEMELVAQQLEAKTTSRDRSQNY